MKKYNLGGNIMFEEEKFIVYPYVGNIAYRIYKNEEKLEVACLPCKC